MNIEISKMNPNDLNNINLCDFDDFWNYNVFKDELTNPNSKYIIAKDENNIVGFAGIWIAIDEAHITNIVTKKSLRHQGVATILMQELIKLSKSSLIYLTSQKSDFIFLLFVKQI